MVPVRGAIRFYLGERLVTLDAVAPERTLLDFLRLDRGLRGTKEGCAEGDCGACTVLVGRLDGERLVYEGVNACIRLLGSLDGCHLVTVEELARDGLLHPVQEAMVAHHASQCGFCTPGIVMSLYGLWLSDPHPGREAVERALQGNLCRCTGYAPIVRAALAVAETGRIEEDHLVRERPRIAARLRELADGHRIEIGAGRARLVLPADADDLAAVLAEEPGATIVAGSTDVGLWVTKFMRDIAPVVFIAHLSDLRRIEETEGAITFGAGVSYAQARDVVRARLPQLGELWDRIGGEQVRNMGTIGGNIANGSPIGDTPPPLIALGASLRLRKGDRRREMALQDFFVDYGKQDREPGEFVEAVTVPLVPRGARFAAYKVSKRREEDISALLGAFFLELDGDRVAGIRIAYGGMAATPRRAKAVEAALLGKAWTREAVEAALPAYEDDFTPLSDWRASAAYRMLAARNLLRRFLLETQGAAGLRLPGRAVA